MASSQVFGQSFVAPDGSPQLTDISFWMGGIYSVRLEIFSFNGTGPAGSALFTSALLSRNVRGFDQETFAIGALALDPGASYIAILHPQSGLPNVLWSGETDPYAAGKMYLATSNPADATTAHYDTDIMGSGTDLTMVANFTQATTVTPEPASMLLVATGLLGMFAGGRRMRRA